ncbi:accessory gene regulator B [Paenibacillus sophorae]|uniref:Accessory gene regulator B n=1 Tax=Paenibacillus sophorae TaxID=1333845 RepID=A0A1H8JK78_9BACL|nr:accessory gene regulator B family protein [Paenibacillus sophorae]QWU13378.1 accessory gene regulator B family protein [Paenibacillus sophorae]SEN80667.1 accessory gene regulator B [Paenibacillus sophorae]
MIDKAALYIATGIKRRIPNHPASVNVLAFSLGFVINTLSIIILSLLISLFTKRTDEITVLLIAFALLRQVSGGFHLNSGVKCVLFTSTIFTLVSLFQLNEVGILILNIISMILILIYAPTDIEKQSRIKRKYYPLLKIISVILISTSFFISSSSLALAFFLQSLTLIRLKGGDK